MTSEKCNTVRLPYFATAKRIVVKVGSAVLTRDNCMNLDAIDNIARDISHLHKNGREVILVSSGAVAAGKKNLVSRIVVSSLLKKSKP